VCSKGIKELEPHFDCLQCEDFTLCKKCFDIKAHEHKMRKNLVPEGCVVRIFEEKIIYEFFFNFSHHLMEKSLKFFHNLKFVNYAK